MIATLIVIICSKNIRRKAPMNYILLAVFTLSLSFLLGVVCAGYETVAVLLAVGITAVLCLALTLFAFQTKWDFTVLGGGLYIACLVLLIFGMLVFIIPVPVLSLVYASLGALLFSIYLIYDTQLLMGGNHKYAISPEEYVAAALTLYMVCIGVLLNK
jgi:protein lifeguard